MLLTEFLRAAQGETRLYEPFAIYIETRGFANPVDIDPITALGENLDDLIAATAKYLADRHNGENLDDSDVYAAERILPHIEKQLRNISTSLGMLTGHLASEVSSLAEFARLRRERAFDPARRH